MLQSISVLLTEDRGNSIMQMSTANKKLTNCNCGLETSEHCINVKSPQVRKNKKNIRLECIHMTWGQLQSVLLVSKNSCC